MGERLLTYQRQEKSISPYQLWRDWTIATTLGEWIGLAIPVVVGAIAANWQITDWALLVLLPIAGMAEGACISFAQFQILQRLFPGFPPRQWIGGTAIAAGIAWLIGQLPSTIGYLMVFNTLWLTVLDGLLGLVLVCAIGTAQWLVLRRYVRRAIWWIPVNAIAWTIGVMIPMAGRMLISDGMPPLARFGVALFCGALMGFFVAVSTGLVLIWLPRRSQLA